MRRHLTQSIPKKWEKDCIGEGRDDFCLDELLDRQQQNRVIRFWFLFMIVWKPNPIQQSWDVEPLRHDIFHVVREKKAYLPCYAFHFSKVQRLPLAYGSFLCPPGSDRTILRSSSKQSASLMRTFCMSVFSVDIVALRNKVTKKASTRIHTSESNKMRRNRRAEPLELRIVVPTVEMDPVEVKIPRSENSCDDEPTWKNNLKNVGRNEKWEDLLGLLLLFSCRTAAERAFNRYQEK